MTPCELLAAHLGSLFECKPVGDHVRIRTPFLYPDGDIVDLYWLPDGDRIPAGTLTDYGETLRWLRVQTAAAKRSPKQDRIIDDVCLNHGVERLKGELSVRVSEDCPMHEAVVKLSQAALRVADISFTFRTRCVASVADDVAEYLTETRIQFECGQRQVGRSGTVWRPDFHTRTNERSAFVYLLATGSRGQARPIVDHVLAAWYDLSHYRATTPGLGFVSLFDDTVDVWAEEDHRLLGDLSDVAFWSRPDEFQRVLREAA